MSRDSAGESVADETLAGTLGDERGRPFEIAPGVTVGRYVVLHELGAGAMGVVHAGYDPELDRKVALKFLKAAREPKVQARLQETLQSLVPVEKMSSLGVLTTGIAHEIKNPTNFAYGSAQNLEVDLKEFREFLMGLTDEESAQETEEMLDQRFFRKLGNKLENKSTRGKMVLYSQNISLK